MIKYNTAKLDKINLSVNNHLKCDIKYINEIMENCYKNIAFSTFGYIFHNTSSEESIDNYNSANCVGMSYYVKKKLLEKGITSYFIPASIPKIYRMDDYLELSHVVLFIPFKDRQFIVDCAFYFLSPLEINLDNNSCNKLIFSKQIYANEHETDLLKYKSIKEIYCNLDFTSEQIFLNQYQIIPKNTYFVNCFYKNDKTDIWRYYIINILNPDEAISNFFIKIKSNPFIVCHHNDSNFLPECILNIKLNDNNIIVKKKQKVNIYSPQDFLKLRDLELENIIKPYFKDISLLKEYVRIFYNI